MHKSLAILAFCVVAASCSPPIYKDINPLKGSSPKGVVKPAYNCGSAGTARQARVSECDGYCTFHPGHLYIVELDFIPSSPFNSTLRLEVEFLTLDEETTYPIFNGDFFLGPYLPGVSYTAHYNLVPMDFFSGEMVDFRSRIINMDNNIVEFCGTFVVTIT